MTMWLDFGTEYAEKNKHLSGYSVQDLVIMAHALDEMNRAISKYLMCWLRL